MYSNYKAAQVTAYFVFHKFWNSMLKTKPKKYNN